MSKNGKYVVEHEFKVRVRLMDDGTVKFRVKSDNDIDADTCYALNVRIGNGHTIPEYEFELGSAEFEHMTWLRKERTTLRTLLKNHLLKNRTKVTTVKHDWDKAARRFVGI